MNECTSLAPLLYTLPVWLLQATGLPNMSVCFLKCMKHPTGSTHAVSLLHRMCLNTGTLWLQFSADSLVFACKKDACLSCWLRKGIVCCAILLLMKQCTAPVPFPYFNTNKLVIVCVCWSHVSAPFFLASFCATGCGSTAEIYCFETHFLYRVSILFTHATALSFDGGQPTSPISRKKKAVPCKQRKGFTKERPSVKKLKSKSLHWKSPACIKERLALARAPLKDKIEKQQRLMRIRRVVSHAIRPAPSPPEASRSTSTPPIRSPIIPVVVKVYFVLFL